MILSTLCYIEKDGCYLMLHRVKKQNDMNHDKWLGVGGKFEEKESPEECVLREAKEETGLTLTDYRLRGILTFVSNEYPTEYIYLYTASKYEGELVDCNEGMLEWVPKARVAALPQWEGDRIFLSLLAEGAPFFSLKLQYEGEKLVFAARDGKAIKEERR